MNTVLLIVTACLHGTAPCREFRMVLDASVPLIQCEMRSQIPAAIWASEHPAWTIRSYRCATVGREGEGT